jgi:hypothetical protein
MSNARPALAGGFSIWNLKRFGRYELNRERVPEPLESIREF